MLNQLGQKATEKCGAHVHIGADYLTSVQSYKNLLEIWCNNEKALYAMVNQKGEAPRTNSVKYASAITPKMQEALKDGTINLENEDELDEFIKELKNVQDRRESGINFMKVNTPDNTIEFRLANGTIDSDMWIENANLYGGMIAISEELAQIQKDGIRSEEDKYKLEIFNKLKENIPEKEKVGILLDLAGVEHETYMERYEVNIELIKNNPELNQMFSEKNTFSFNASEGMFKGKGVEEFYGEVSAIAQIEAGDNIVEAHERNIQNEKNNKNKAH